MVDAVRLKQLIRVPVLKCWTRVVIRLALHASPVVGALHQSLYTISNHRLTRPFMSLEKLCPHTPPTAAIYSTTWPHNERSDKALNSESHCVSYVRVDTACKRRKTRRLSNGVVRAFSALAIRARAAGPIQTSTGGGNGRIGSSGCALGRGEQSLLQPPRHLHPDPGRRI
ncbi:hypothetical protein GW17_00013618 [Ensete ventricosum]|nr:hypothetical protein GW17_00013618 [Ensete ventricosum]